MKLKQLKFLSVVTASLLFLSYSCTKDNEITTIYNTQSSEIIVEGEMILGKQLNNPY